MFWLSPMGAKDGRANARERTAKSVFPAHAWMNRPESSFPYHISGVPRARGDEPGPMLDIHWNIHFRRGSAGPTERSIHSRQKKRPRKGGAESQSALTGAKWSNKMSTQNITDLQQKFRLAFFDDDMDEATRIATDAVEAGIPAKKVSTEMALAQFSVEEALDKIRNSPQPTGSGPPEAEALTLVKASDVQQRDATWLWPRWLPRGELTLLAGQPKTGKTTLALSVASILSRGGKWPSGERAKKANTIFWTSEDSLEKTIAPRLSAAGADLDRIRFINYGKRIDFDPAQHMNILQEVIKDEGVGLLILDPIICVLDSKRDSHNATNVRHGLADLQNMIGGLDLAVIGITHFAKGTQGGNVLERMIGSQVWGAAARVVWAAARDSDSGKRTLVQVKNNLAEEAGAFDYSIEVPDGHKVTAAVWGAQSNITAEEVLHMSESTDRESEDKNAKEAAMEWFIDLLDGMGWVSSTSIDEEMKSNHVSISTLRRARDLLKRKGEVECRRYHGRYEWRIPGQEEEPTFPPIN